MRNGRLGTLSVAFWSSRWWCLNHQVAVLTFVPGVCNWSLLPNLLVTQFILWPVQSDFGTSWLQSPETSCQPKQTPRPSTPSPLGTEIRSGELTLQQHYTIKRIWKCVWCWKSQRSLFLETQKASQDLQPPPFTSLTTQALNLCHSPQGEVGHMPEQWAPSFSYSLTSHLSLLLQGKRWVLVSLLRSGFIGHRALLS